MEFGIPRRRILITAGAASIGALTMDTAAWADHSTDTATPLVRVRSASRSLPMEAAAANGYFVREKLDVDYALFVSSRPTFVQIDQREIEIIISSMDNSINYQLNPGNPAGRILDNVIIAAHDLGLGLALAAAPGFPTAQSLRGQRIGVDVPHSGFSLPAEKILLSNGLMADRDYSLVPAGSTPARLTGILDGRWQAAIINAEAIPRAHGAGLPFIGSVSDGVRPYQGGILAANRGWLSDNPMVAVRFLRAFIRAMVWVFDPRNRDAAIGLLVDEQTTAQLAAEIYDLNVGADGLARRAAVDLTAFRNVLGLRDEFHGFETPQDLDLLSSPAGGLYDLRFHRRASHDVDCPDL